MLPPLACGHGMELMQARLDIDGQTGARLEMTADYGGNPMLSSEEDARAALQDLLRVEVGGAWHKLTELAPLKLEPRQQFDPASPMPAAPDPEGRPHQLLTAVWQGPAPAGGLRFMVPKGCVHDVLLWRPNAGGQPFWRVLITGDVSPLIEVPAAPAAPSVMGWRLSFVLLTAGLLGFLWSRRKTACRPAILSPSSLP